jgi:hypothetical protein
VLAKNYRLTKIELKEIDWSFLTIATGADDFALPAVCQRQAKECDSEFQW